MATTEEDVVMEGAEGQGGPGDGKSGKPDKYRGYSDSIYNMMTSENQDVVKMNGKTVISSDDFFRHMTKNRRYAAEVYNVMNSRHGQEKDFPSQGEFLDFFFQAQSAEAKKQGKDAAVSGGGYNLSEYPQGLGKAKSSAKVLGADVGKPVSPASKGVVPKPGDKPVVEEEESWLDATKKSVQETFVGLWEGAGKLFSEAPPKDPRRGNAQTPVENQMFINALEKDKDFGGELEARNTQFKSLLSINTSAAARQQAIGGLTPTMSVYQYGGPEMEKKARTVANAKVEYDMASSIYMKMQSKEMGLTPAETKYLQMQKVMDKGVDYAMKYLDGKRQQLGGYLDDVMAGEEELVGYRKTVDNTVSAVERGQNARYNAFANFNQRIKMGEQALFTGIRERYEDAKANPDKQPTGGMLSTVGELAGGMWEPMMVGGALSLVPKAGVFLAAGYSAYDAGATSYGMAVESYYQQARDKGVPHKEAAVASEAMGRWAGGINTMVGALSAMPGASNMGRTINQKVMEKLGVTGISKLLARLPEGSRRAVVAEMIDVAATSATWNMLGQITENFTAMRLYPDKWDIKATDGLIMQATVGSMVPLAIGLGQSISARKKAGLVTPQEAETHVERAVRQIMAREDLPNKEQAARLVRQYFTEGTDPRDKTQRLGETDHVKKVVAEEKAKLKEEAKKAREEGDHDARKEAARKLKELEDTPITYLDNQMQNTPDEGDTAAKRKEYRDAIVEMQQVREFNAARDLEGDALSRKGELDLMVSNLEEELKKAMLRNDELMAKSGKLELELKVATGNKKQDIQNKYAQNVKQQKNQKQRIADFEADIADVKNMRSQLDVRLDDTNKRVNGILEWMGLRYGDVDIDFDAGITTTGAETAVPEAAEAGAQASRTPETEPGGGGTVRQGTPESNQGNLPGQGAGGSGQGGANAPMGGEPPAILPGNVEGQARQGTQEVAYKGRSLDDDAINLQAGPNRDAFAAEYGRAVNMEQMVEGRQRQPRQRGGKMPEGLTQRIAGVMTDFKDKLLNHYGSLNIDENGRLPLLHSTLDTIDNLRQEWRDKVDDYRRKGDTSNYDKAKNALKMAEEDPFKFLVAEYRRYTGLAGSVDVGPKIDAIAKATSDAMMNLDERVAQMESRIYGKDGLLETYVSGMQGVEQKALAQRIMDFVNNGDRQNAERLVLAQRKKARSAMMSDDDLLPALREIANAIDHKIDLAKEARSVFGTGEASPTVEAALPRKVYVPSDRAYQFINSEKQRLAKQLLSHENAGTLTPEEYARATETVRRMNDDPYGYISEHIDDKSRRINDLNKEVNRLRNGRDVSELSPEETTKYNKLMEKIEALEKKKKNASDVRKSMEMTEEEYQKKKMILPEPSAQNPQPEVTMTVGGSPDPNDPPNVVASDNEYFNSGQPTPEMTETNVSAAIDAHKQRIEVLEETMKMVVKRIATAIDPEQEANLRGQLKAMKDEVDYINSQISVLGKEAESNNRIARELNDMLDRSGSRNPGGKRRDFAFQEQDRSTPMGKLLDDFGYSNMAEAYTGLMSNNKVRAFLGNMDMADLRAYVHYYRNVGGILNMEYNWMQLMEAEVKYRMTDELRALEAQGLKNSNRYDQLKAEFIKEMAMQDKERSTLGRMLSQIVHVFKKEHVIDSELKKIMTLAEADGTPMTLEQAEMLRGALESTIDAELAAEKAIQKAELFAGNPPSTTSEAYAKMNAEVKAAVEAHKKALNDQLRILSDIVRPRLLDILKANQVLGFMTTATLTTNLGANMTHALLSTVQRMVVGNGLSVATFEKVFRAMGKPTDFSAMRSGGAKSVLFSMAEVFKNLGKVREKLMNSAPPPGKNMNQYTTAMYDAPIREFAKTVIGVSEALGHKLGVNVDNLLFREASDYFQITNRNFLIKPDGTFDGAGLAKDVYKVFTAIYQRTPISRILLATDEVFQQYGKNLEAYDQAYRIAKQNQTQVDTDLARLLVSLTEGGSMTIEAQNIREIATTMTFTNESAPAKMANMMFQGLTSWIETKTGYRTDGNLSALAKIGVYIGALSAKGLSPYITVPMNVAMYNLRLSQPWVSLIEAGFAIRNFDNADPVIRNQAVRKFGQALGMYTMSALMQAYARSFIEDDVLVGEGDGSKTVSSLIKNTIGSQSINMSAVFRDFGKHTVKAVAYASADMADVFGIFSAASKMMGGKSLKSMLSDAFNESDMLRAGNSFKQGDNTIHYNRLISFGPVLSMYADRYAVARTGGKGETLNAKDMLDNLSANQVDLFKGFLAGEADADLISSGIVEKKDLGKPILENLISDEASELHSVFINLMGMQFFNNINQVVSMFTDDDTSKLNAFYKMEANSLGTGFGAANANLRQWIRTNRGYQSENKYMVYSSESRKEMLDDVFSIEFLKQMSPFADSPPKAMKLDPFGEVVKTKEEGESTFMAMFDIVKMKDGEFPPYKHESLRLAMSYGAAVVPRYPPRVFKYSSSSDRSKLAGMEIEIPPEAYERFVLKTGEAQRIAFEEVMDRPWYDGLEDKDKARELNNAMSTAFSRVYEEAMDEFRPLFIKSFAAATDKTELEAANFFESDAGMQILQETILETELQGRPSLREEYEKRRRESGL